MEGNSAGERQALSDAIQVGGMNGGGLAEGTAALAALGLVQMPASRPVEERLAISGEFEPLGHGFLRFDAFWTTHNISRFP